LALLEQAAEQAATIRFAPVLPEILGALGATYLLVGRLAETRHTAERMLQMTRASGKRPSQGDALRILAEVHAQANPGEFSQAEEAYREALAIRRADRGVTARCPLPPRLGKLYRRTAKREQAREHLATATAMYREMGMTYWLEQAEAEMRRSA
jgi:tetratricopeptide (TPR) repeat protein